MGTRIGVYLFEGVEELDWVGPWEVLASWAHWFPKDQVSVYTVARTEGPVCCAKGMRVLPDHAVEDAPSPDVLLVPGGQGTRPQIGDEDVKSWLRRAASSGVLMTSVCTGSLLLADAGLLDDRPATTHWASLEALGEMGERIDVRTEGRFVDAGEVVTAAGVSAGIDMALHLVARLASEETARQVRRYIEYDPAPPV